MHEMGETVRRVTERQTNSQKETFQKCLLDKQHRPNCGVSSLYAYVSDYKKASYHIKLLLLSISKSGIVFIRQSLSSINQAQSPWY